MTDTTTERLAVLIDAENISAKHVSEIFEEVATLGEASLRRIYGDFSGDIPQGWSAEKLAEYAIVPHQQFANTIRKNAGDIALVIDAMDILHSGRFDGFVLVSSDSDFTRLVSRIREQGLSVFGIGKEKAPWAFKAACNRYISIENIKKDEPQATSDAKGKNLVPIKEINHASQLIRNVVLKSAEPDGWAELGWLGNQLLKNYPSFDTRSYGFGRLSDLVRATGKFEEAGTNGSLKIRPKDK